MIEKSEVMFELVKVSNCIKHLLNVTQFDENCEENIKSIDRTNPQDLFIENQLNSFMQKLEDIRIDIEYMKFPVKYESKLRKNEYHRYETCKGDDYTSGSLIEFLNEDPNYDYPFWEISTVEYKGNDYYIVGAKDVTMAGLKVRIR